MNKFSEHLLCTRHGVMLWGFCDEWGTQPQPSRSPLHSKFLGTFLNFHKDHIDSSGLLNTYFTANSLFTVTFLQTFFKLICIIKLCKGSFNAVLFSFRIHIVVWWVLWLYAEKECWMKREEGVMWIMNLFSCFWYLMRMNLGIWMTILRSISIKIHEIFSTLKILRRATKCMVYQRVKKKTLVEIS